MRMLFYGLRYDDWCDLDACKAALEIKNDVSIVLENCMCTLVMGYLSGMISAIQSDFI